LFDRSGGVYTATLPAAARLTSLTGTSSDSNRFARSKHLWIFVLQP
jgi:hypothetical protein